MRLGVLARSLEQVEAIARAGYACAELSVSAVMEPDDAGFKAARSVLAETGLNFGVFYEPLPPEVEICVQGFNKFIWREYLKKACFRSSELGGKRFVFSNGDSRSLPFEGDVQSAREKVMAFIVMLCEIAKEYGITIMLEPLEEPLSNIYNTLGECASLIRLLGASNLTSMYSLRYFAAAGFALGDIERHKDIISHVHIDYPFSPYAQRLCPKEDDGYDYGIFFDMLNKIRYNGDISVTSDTYTDYEAEITSTAKYLQKLTTLR